MPHKKITCGSKETQLAFTIGIVIFVCSTGFLNPSTNQYLSILARTKENSKVVPHIQSSNLGDFGTVPRVIALGDIHGDISVLHRCLRIAKVIKEDWTWCGADTVVVQLGDLIDRGDEDLQVLLTIHKLDELARVHGGRVISLIGNHELMNLQGDFSFSTSASMKQFNKLLPELNVALSGDWSCFSKFPEAQRCRAAALSPGGFLSSILKDHPVVLKVGSTLFVHGGLLPHHAFQYSLEEMNQLTSQWILGKASIPSCISRRNSLLWSRSYSHPPNEEMSNDAKDNLDLTLQLTCCKRMVVAHTPQYQGVNSAHNGKLWRVDTGGLPEVLEVWGENVKILTENGYVAPESRAACSFDKSLHQLKERSLDAVFSLPCYQ